MKSALNLDLDTEGAFNDVCRSSFDFIVNASNVFTDNSKTQELNATQEEQSYGYGGKTRKINTTCQTPDQQTQASGKQSHQ
jgi:hypothetical protein